MTREEAIERLNNAKGCPLLYDSHVEAIEMAISALDQEPVMQTGKPGNEYIFNPAEPCGDAISREAVIKLFNGNIGSEAALILHKVKQLPSVTQKPGKWINDKDDMPTCSECGYIPQYNRAIDDYEYSNYCPSCGAKMVEPQESEDKE